MQPDVNSIQKRAAQLRAQAEQRAQQAENAAGRSQQSSAERQEEAGVGPVGQGDYVVKQGDCIYSIAKDHGYAWEAIWNAPDNAELKQVRRNPGILFPMDRVTLPKKSAKLEPGETEMRHRFVRGCEPVELNLRILRNDEPRANEPFLLQIDDHVEIEGTLDGDGRLIQQIPPNACRGELTVGQEGEEEVYQLDLGKLDPVDEITGVQGRLKNLGQYDGDMTGVLDDRTRDALKAYQSSKKLEVSGRPDQATKDALVEDYGS